MNTSAFVTAIRIKIVENQSKTYFFLFAFCLLTTSISLERIIGNLLAERLEVERKNDFVKGIEASLEERWKLHLGQIRSYAYWPEVWELIKTKKQEKAYLYFQLDPSLDKQFDFFGIYLNPDKPFITKWSDGSGNKITPENKIISYLYELQSGKEGYSNHLLFFNHQYYLVSVASLTDTRGKPVIDGIMIFAYELDHFIQNTNNLFPIKIEAVDNEEIPLNLYESISLEKLCMPGNKKVILTIAPNFFRLDLIRPYLIGILALYSIISLGLFSWILYKLKSPSLY